MSGNATPQQPVYVRLNLDDDGDGQRDTSLFYYPGNNGVVQQGTWQTVDSRPTASGASTATRARRKSVTLDDYLVAHPDATIVNNADGAPLGGGVAFLVGGGGTADQMNGEYFLDDVNIGKVDAATGHTKSSDEFDLEPTSPAVSVGDASVLEGNDGAKLKFPVTLDSPAGKDVTVTYQTSDGTAKAGKDYRTTKGERHHPGRRDEGGREGAGHLGQGARGRRVADPDARLARLRDPGRRHRPGTIRNDDTRVGLKALPATEAGCESRWTPCRPLKARRSRSTGSWAATPCRSSGATSTTSDA